MILRLLYGLSLAKSSSCISPSPEPQRSRPLVHHNSQENLTSSLSGWLLHASMMQVVGAKYNGQGPPIPPDCPTTVGKLMKSCWSNLPSSRPSFEKICEHLEGAEGWWEEDSEGEGLADTGASSASPLDQEQQQGQQQQQRSRTAIVSPLHELEESGLEVDGSVGSPGSGGSGGPTPSGMPTMCFVCGGRAKLFATYHGRSPCWGGSE